MSKLTHETINLHVAGASPMQAYVARPKREQAPAILVLQEAFGVNGHIRDIANRFAAEGYLAVAPELFHRTAPRGFEGDYQNFPSVAPHYQAVTTTTMAADFAAVYAWLQADAQADAERVGAIGFCMGGRAAFFANTVLPLKAAVAFYGGGIATDLLPLCAKQHGPITFVWGGKDQHIGADQRRAINDAMHKAQKIFTDVEFSDADHGFMNHDRPAYHPASAQQAWSLATAFLRTYVLGKGAEAGMRAEKSGAYGNDARSAEALS